MENSYIFVSNIYIYIYTHQSSSRSMVTKIKYGKLGKLGSNGQRWFREWGLISDVNGQRLILNITDRVIHEQISLIRSYISHNNEGNAIELVGKQFILFEQWKDYAIRTYMYILKISDVWNGERGRIDALQLQLANYEMIGNRRPATDCR